MRINIATEHKDINNKTVEFDLVRDESLGTNLLFDILCIVFKTFEEGGVLFIDEIDSSMHPILLRHIIELFKDKRYNTSGAQLICTLHNTDLLDCDAFRLSEVAFLNKDTRRGTFLVKLAQFETAGAPKNMRKKYLNGEYGGIPYPYI